MSVVNGIQWFPNLPHEFLPVCLFPVGILLPGQCLHHDLPVFVTSSPWQRAVLHQNGSKRALDRFPEALGQNPTCRTDRCDLRYGLLPAILSKDCLLPSENLGSLPKLECDFPQLRQAQKQLDSYVENVGINRGNLSLTVEKYSLQNAVFIVRDKYTENSKNY